MLDGICINRGIDTDVVDNASEVIIIIIRFVVDTYKLKLYSCLWHGLVF